MSDLINREDIIRLVCSEEYAKRMDGEMLGAVITLLLDTPKEELPSVEKTGHWFPNSDGIYECSECHVYAHDFDSHVPDNGDDPYCWNCGARMVRE